MFLLGWGGWRDLKTAEKVIGVGGRTDE